MAEQHQNIDFEILWKKIHHKISEEEEIRLNKWLDEHSSHRKYYENAIRYYATGTQFANSPAELENALRTVYRKTGIYTPNRNIRTITITSITAIAAGILLFIYFQFFTESQTKVVPDSEQQVQLIVPGSNRAVLILADGTEHDLTSGDNSLIQADGAEIKNTGRKLEYISKNEQATEIKYNTLKVPRGGEYFLVLSDSTKVWLNSETTLRFPVQFANNIRSLELIGEAYFEVYKNEDSPFIVISNNQQVRVLGTQFNISSYPEDNAIYTTLVEGKVEIGISTNPDKKLTLSPNEQSVLVKNDGLIQKRIVDVNQYIAWKDGRFVFQDQMLEEIMETLSKWYNIQIIFANEGDKKLRFTGNLERYTDFSNILEKIERTNEVKFEITNNTIMIK